jgi:hypothetical protein
MLSSKMSSLNFGLTVFLLLTSLSPFTVAQSLPQVDLGYEIHQAIAFNVRTLSFRHHLILTNTISNQARPTTSAISDMLSLP